MSKTEADKLHAVKLDARTMLLYSRALDAKDHKDKAKATAMTLMIAKGNYPDAPQFKEPKQAEVINVQ